MGSRRWWFVVLMLSVAWLLVGTTCKEVREAQIVSFEISPSSVVAGGSVFVAWQAEFVGLRDGGPYCTLQRTFEDASPEPLAVVPCIGSRTDAIGADVSAGYVNYRFSALRRSGQSYESEVVQVAITRDDVDVDVEVLVVPESVTLEPGGVQDFTATVTGASDTSVTWSRTCGSISGSGNTITYTAPSSVPDPATCLITATSVANPDTSASASVTVVHGTGAVVWTRQFGTSSDDAATSVAVDAAGNVVVAGSTLGSLEGANVGGSDAFVRKFDGAGNVLWTRQFGTSSDDTATDVAFDASGNVIVTGTTDGALEGDSAGRTDAFVRKFDAAGNVLWTRQFGTSRDDHPTGIAVDGSGNAFVVGWTEGSFWEWEHGGVIAFARMYAPDGSDVWTREFGVSPWDAATGVAVDVAGNALVVGSTAGSIGRANPGGIDVFVVTHDASGESVGVLQFGGTWGGAYFGEGIAVDGLENLLVVGSASGTLDGALGSGSVFVRKHDAAKNVLWTRQFGASDEDSATSVAVDGSANVVVVGATLGSLEGANAGGSDAYVRKLDAAGNVVWTRQFGTSNDDGAKSVAVDASGNVLVVGRTLGSLEGANAGGSDAFVRKYAP